MTPSRIARPLGVRFQDSPRLHFFLTDIDGIMSGDWVIVPSGEAERLAQVVVAPDQLVKAGLDGTLPLTLRKLDRNEAEALEPACRPSSWDAPARVDTGNPGKRLIGGPGYFDPRRNRSYENDRRRQSLRHFPRLGDRARLAQPTATVISMQIDEGLVTIRYDEGGREETLPAADVLSMINSNTEEA